jgi:hypothetical protein
MSTTLLPEPADILILSNGPGELATWVRPVVKALRSLLGDDPNQVRISLVLSPCVNASGQEAAIASRYPEINRVQAAADFNSFLLWGQTRDGWDWRRLGVVLFLGGDQFFTVVIGKRLGYRTVIYAEWQARWLKWADRFGLAQPHLQEGIPARYAHKLTVVGDLMAEAAQIDPAQQQAIAKQLNLTADQELIGLLPGSKPLKLGFGVPMSVAIAEHIHRSRPQTRFVIPVAPSLDLATLARYANPEHNRLISVIQGGSARLVEPVDAMPYLETETGVRIYLWTVAPAYDLLAQCQLCLTTVGANTAELTALAVPMLVLLPTQQQDAMRAWDGLPGLLANLPIVGRFWAVMIVWIVIGRGLGWRTWWQIWAGKTVNWSLVKQGLGLRAWPNIWAGKEIVPELVGPLQAEDVAEQALGLLTEPERRSQMQMDLKNIRGETGAALKLAQLVATALAPIT